MVTTTICPENKNAKKTEKPVKTVKKKEGSSFDSNPNKIEIMNEVEKFIALKVPGKDLKYVQSVAGQVAHSIYMRRKKKE